MLVLFLPKRVYAVSPKAEISTNTTYVIKDDGVAIVSHNFNLTNLYSEFAPEKIVIDPGIKDITKLEASGVDASLKDNKITLKFPPNILGLGKSHSWGIRYQTSAIASHSGRLWIISIPKPFLLEGQRDLNLSVRVPVSFGKQISIYPKPISELSWDGMQLSDGVRIVYDPTGVSHSYQEYTFSLGYSLHNSRLYPVSTEITLPTDSNYQRVYLDDIFPKPINVRIDDNGNWLANYQLGPAANLEIKVKGTVVVSDKPFFNQPQTKVLNLSLGDPLKIYRFLVDSPTQALDNLSKPSPFQITDIFVALSQEAGIPARKVEGYYSGSLHVWPEYFDKDRGAWISVDPELERKYPGSDYFHSLDLEHIPLLIHSSSEIKSVAMASVLNFTPAKDSVSLSEKPRIGLRVEVPPFITAGFASKIRVYIENYGPVLFSGNIVNISSNELFLPDRAKTSGALAPFSTKTVEFTIPAIDWRTSSNDIITVQFLGEVRKGSVAVQPFTKNKFLLSISILFLLGILSIIAQIARGLPVLRQRRNSNLRGKGPQSS